MKRKLPFSVEDINKLKKQYNTPFYIYDEKALISRIEAVNNAFAWNSNYKEYYAIKALPNPHILKILKKHSCGFDAASMCEIVLADKVKSKDIMFTSNNPTKEDYLMALQAKAIINFDAYEQIDNLLDVLKQTEYAFPNSVCFRYNPGRFEIDASFIGELESSKFGMSKKQLIEGIQKAKELGAKRFGIHAMLAGNALDENYYALEAELLFKLAKEIKEILNINIDFFDLAGGVGIAYKEDQKEVDIKKVGNKVKEVYKKYFKDKDYQPAIFTEMGRYISGPIGYLVTSVTNVKETYRKYIGVDASMADLMRPGMYGSYHHIEVLNNSKKKDIYDVVGPICENNDKFAIQRQLNVVNKNDILVICDAGAHSRSMGFNYNGRLRAGELLLTKENKYKLIRRKETIEDYLATIVE